MRGETSPRAQHKDPEETCRGEATYYDAKPRTCAGQRARKPWSGKLFRAECLNAEASAAGIYGHLGEPCGRQAVSHSPWIKRHKGASDVSDAVKPAIRDVESKKNAAGTKHTKNLSECAVLQFPRFQVMEHENGDRRRKRSADKRQRRGIPLNRPSIRIARSCCKDGDGSVIVLETRHARCYLCEFESCCTTARAQFQDMVAQLSPVQEPRQQLPPGYVAPERRPANPIFVGIHNSFSNIGKVRTRTLVGSTTTMQPLFKDSSRPARILLRSWN